MKEGRHTTGGMGDPSRKRKKKRGGTNFTSSKQRRHREVKKREASCTEGWGTPPDLSESA